MRLALLLAVRLLRRRGTVLLRTSSLAALSAVALGVAALVVVLALMNGYRNVLRSGIFSAAGHVVASFPGGLTDSERERLVPRLGAISGVRQQAEAHYLPGLLLAGAGGGEVVQIKATGTWPSFIPMPPVASGPSVEIALGRGLARRLGLDAGSSAALQVVAGGRLPRSVRVHVASVFRTGFSELDERWVLVGLADLERSLGSVPATAVELWLDDPDDAERVRETAERVCGGSALVTTWQDLNRNLFAALRWQKLSLAVVLSLVVGVGAFEVASALVVLLTEKRREIGVLMAMGGDERLVRTTLVLAGTALGATGLLLGVTLGVGIAAVLNSLGVPRFPPEIASIYMVERIPFSLEGGDLLTVLALGLAEVAIAAAIPAVRVARREPVEVLRWV